MKMSMVACDHCGSPISRPTKEVTRSIKLKRRTFCNNSCQGKLTNSKRKVTPLDKMCPHCLTMFASSNKARAATFCSRSCASAGSVTDARRTCGGFNDTWKKNFANPSAGLKKREAWKYVNLRPALKDINHEFEYGLDDYVFDLALFDHHVLVEFDGPYHRIETQRRADAVKEAAANKRGFKVIRLQTEQAKVIPASLLDALDIVQMKCQ